MKIFVFCPDDNSPVGGIRILYRHVDVLRKHGYDARIVHMSRNFRCTWFENETPVVGMDDLQWQRDHVVVIPENYGENAGDALPLRKKGLFGRKDVRFNLKDVKKVIFNQNGNYTFDHHSLDPHVLTTPYLRSDVLATMVVSNKDYDYLKWIFPHMPVFRIHNSIDRSIFYPGPKERLICYMPRKNPMDIQRVVNGVKFLGALEGWKLQGLHGLNQMEVASKLRHAAVFLSTGVVEGLALPPLEAMASGCVMVGYHGNNAAEFCRPEFCYPVEAHNIIEYTRVLQAVLSESITPFDELVRKGALASEFVHSSFSVEQEEQDIVNAWFAIEAKM